MNDDPDNKKVKKKKRLADKFTLFFNVPFFIGTLFAISATCVFVNIYYKRIAQNDNVLNIFVNSFQEKSFPLLLNSIVLLNSYFQKYINNLSKIKAIYNNTHNNNTQSNCNFKTYFINAFNDINNISSQCSGEMLKDTYCNKFKWLTYDNETSINDTNEERKNQLHNQMKAVYHLLPLLKTIYLLSKPSEIFSIMFPNTDLFIEYPINTKSFMNVNQYSHNSYCKTNRGNFPNHFYFRCRPFYHSIEQAKLNGLNFSISDTYNFTDGNEGISSCIRFTKDDSDEVIICQDFLLDELSINLEQINNLLNGYFFITKVNSSIPIYYPNSEDNLGKVHTIISHEFNIKTQYFSQELSEYITKAVDLSKYEKDVTSLTSFPTFPVVKNGKKYQYITVPCTINFDNKIEHIMSVVYVCPSGLDVNIFNVNTNGASLITCFFVVISLISVLLSKYFITAIPNNIVKQFKIIKEMLETNYEITTEVSQEQQQLKLYNNDNNEDDNSSADEEEDKSKYRSNNIQRLFLQLTDLKTTYKNLRNPTISNGSQNLPSLLLAQNVCKEINDNSSYSTCHSNISLTFIKSKQYDKAISHLLNTIHKTKVYETYSYKKNNNAISINIDELKYYFKSENITSRYNQLFYCYSQYFKEIKLKVKNVPLHALMHSQSMNNGSLLLAHTINHYGQAVKDFVEITKIVGDNQDIYIALLENLNEQISMELPIHPKETIRNILNIFNEIDNIEKKKLSSINYNVIHLLTFSNLTSDNINSMETPPSILTQYSNYLRGEFYLKCGFYKEAIVYLEKSLKFGNVGNFKIKMQCIKKLITIAKQFQEIIKREKEFCSHEPKYKKEEENNRIRLKYLECFVQNLTKEINGYNHLNRDICFIVNLINEPKKQVANILKIILFIYENIILHNDRFSIIVYMNDEFSILLKLTNKTEENELLLYNLINNLNTQISKNINTNTFDLLKVNENVIEKAILYSYHYLIKKQMSESNSKRDSWYIYVTRNINDIELNSLTTKPLSSYYRKELNQNMLVICFQEYNDNDNGSESNENDYINSIKHHFTFNKSNIITHKELDKIKDIMGITRIIRDDVFEMEKYK